MREVLTIIPGVLTDSQVLMIINGMLLAVVVWFLQLAITVVRSALATITTMQIHQAAQTETLKSLADAIARHERVIEKWIDSED